MQSARRIDYEHVVTFGLRFFKRAFDYLLRIYLPHFKHGDVRAFAHHLQLFDGCGAIYVTCDQKRLFALLSEHNGKFSAHRRLSAALQTAHQNYRGRLVRDRKFGRASAHYGCQLVPDYRNDLLRGRKAFEHLLSHRFFTYVIDKLLYHR